MPDSKSQPGFTFSNEPPAAVRDYFTAKGLQPSFDWKEVWAQEHAFAFTVAKATELDVLTSIRDSLQQSLDKGGTFADWKKDLTPELQRLGWWGRDERTDPDTGEVREVQLGSPRRLRTIWRTNMRTARAAGQWERGQQSKTGLPYYLYRLGPSEVHRPHHVEKDGLILPVDDPFWNEWFPPNGWGCKCWLRQITESEARSLGYSGAPAPAVPDVPFKNDRTGETLAVPRGIDPGWASNPGKARGDNLAALLSRKLISSNPDLARAAAIDLARLPQFQRFVEEASAKGQRRKGADNPEPWSSTPWPIAIVPTSIQRIAGTKTGLVVVNEAAIGHATDQRNYTPRQWSRAQIMLERGEIWKMPGGELRVLAFIEGRTFMLPIKATVDKSVLRIRTMFETGLSRLAKTRREGELVQGADPKYRPGQK